MKSASTSQYESSSYVSLDNISIRRSLVEERSRLKKISRDDSSEAVRMANLVASNQRGIQSKIFLGYKVEIESTLFNISREIEIPKHFLGMRKYFYAKITAILRKDESLIKKNKLSTSIFFTIDHKSKVDDLLVPVYPPEIDLILDRKGIVIFGIRQVDPAATKLTVSKRVISPRREHLSNSKIMSVLSLEAESPRKIISDYGSENIFPNSVIYRVISESTDGRSGPFSSILVPGHYNINTPTAKEEPNKLSIIAVNEENRIKIDIEQIPLSVVGVRLLKEEIDETGELSSRVRAVVESNTGKTLIDTYGNVKKLTYFDSDIDLNRRYRYFCALRPKLGYEFLSEEDEYIVRKRPMKPLPVDVSLGNSQVSRDEKRSFTVSIDVLSTPKSEGMDFLFNTLKKSGVSSVFMRQIQKQKEQFAKNRCLCC